MKMYFAADGNYGESLNMVVLDASSFTEDDWNLIDMAADHERANLASKIYRSKP